MTVPDDASASAAPDPDAERAARAWLALTDAGRAEDSWRESASLFRAAVTAAQWAQSLRAAREPLGALVSREVTAATRATELPGAPDGEYVVLQFASAFVNKRQAVETVTPMRDTDGAWRVAGYFIR